MDIPFNGPFQSTYDAYQKRGQQGQIARADIPSFFDVDKVGSLGAYTELVPGQPVIRNATTGAWEPQDDVSLATHIIGIERTSYNKDLTPPNGNQTSYVSYTLDQAAKGLINGCIFLLVSEPVTFNQFLAWNTADRVWQPLTATPTQSHIVVQALTKKDPDSIVEAYVYQSFVTPTP